MKFKPSEIQQLLRESYKKKVFDNIDEKFIVDLSISNERTKVYQVENSNDVIVVHRGSEDKQDWIDNALWLRANILTMSRSYKLHLKRHKLAVKKYGAENIIVMGHSRGGLYAKQFYDDKLAKQLITFNKPVNFHNIIYNKLTKNKNKHDENQTKIRTEKDFVSIGEKFIKNNDTDITIPSNSENIFKDIVEEHKVENLEKLNNDELIGTGIFKQKINFKKIKKQDLKQFIKQNKKIINLDINITGLTKKELVMIIEQFYE